MTEPLSDAHVEHLTKGWTDVTREAALVRQQLAREVQEWRRRNKTVRTTIKTSYDGAVEMAARERRRAERAEADADRLAAVAYNLIDGTTGVSATDVRVALTGHEAVVELRPQVTEPDVVERAVRPTRSWPAMLDDAS